MTDDKPKSIRLYNLFMQPLLRSKTTIPPTRPKQIERNRLFDRLQMGVKRGLTLVVAPAGFGKTTLAAAWAHLSKMPVAWLTLQSTDHSRERLLSYLIQSIQTISPQLGQSTQAILQSGSFEDTLFSLANDLAAVERNFALVLDDYHSIESPEVNQVIQFLLDNRPPSFHLVIISRVTPNLNLIRLRAQDQVQEIQTSDLRFTDSEVFTFLKTSMGLQLPEDHIRQLIHSSEGWAVGLQLAAIALARQPSDLEQISSKEYIFDYLAQEVLQREPPEIQDFLIRTSLFERFSIPLCEQIIPIKEESDQFQMIKDILAYIERKNLFLVSMDETWFRYHALFADFLRKQISPELASSLFYKVSIWSEKNNLLDDAIHYAIQAEDFSRAASLIEDQYICMMQRGEHAALIEWISALPVELVNRQPKLLLALGWANIITMNIKDASVYLERAESILPVGPEWNHLRDEAKVQRILHHVFIGKDAIPVVVEDMDEILAEDNEFLHSLLHFNLGMYYVMTGDTSKAVDALSEAIQYLETMENPLVTLVCMLQMGETRMMRGAFGLAERTFQQAIQFITDKLGRNTFLLGMPYISYGELLRERNQFSEAMKYLEQGISHCQRWQPITAMDGQISLARLLAARGEYVHGMEILEQIMRIAEKSTTVMDDRLIAATMLRLAILHGDEERARQCLQVCDREGVLSGADYIFWELSQIQQIRYDIQSPKTNNHDFQSILNKLTDLLGKSETYERITSTLELLILQAYAYEKMGRADSVVETLSRALSIGAQSGYIRIFADEAQPLLALLEKYQNRLTVPGTYLHQIIEIMRSERENPKRQKLSSQPADIFTPLTRRELDILKLLAEGCSNQEIAVSRVLTVNTVKKHVGNIMSKMGVDNRTQAVLFARKVGWIE